MLPHRWRGPLLALLVAFAPLASAEHLGPVPHPDEDPVPTPEPVPPPDLIPTNVHGTVSDETRPTTLCNTVMNVGRMGGPNGQEYTPNGPFDVTLHVDGFEAGYKRVTEAMAPGQGVDVCIDVQLDKGRHLFHFVVDTAEEVKESNEENNRGKQWYVDVSGPPKPELYVKSLQVGPQFARQGTSTQVFLAIIRNGGNANSTPTVVDFTDDNGRLARLDIPALLPGQETQVNTQTNPRLRAYGTFVVRATVDPIENVTEWFEENNERSTTYGIERHPLPDLRFGEIKVNGSRIEGRTLRLEATVFNVGDLDAGSFTLRIEDNGTTIREVGRSSLAKGKNTTAQILLNLGAGEHPLRLTLDPDRRVAEHNDSDNVREIFVVIEASTVNLTLPNLAVESIDAAPYDPRPGETVTIIASVHNVGPIRVNETQLEFSVNGAPIGRATTPAMDPGRWATVSWSWPVDAPGSYTLRAIADATRTLTEADEDDNMAAQTFIIITPPPPEPPKNNDSVPTATPPPTPTVPVTPTPNGTTRDPTRPSESGSVLVDEVSVNARQVPDGVKGIIVAVLRNPSLDQLPRMSITFRIDGSPAKEVLVEGLRPAATAPISTGEIDLPPGAHTVEVEVRFVGRPDVISKGGSEYATEAGESSGIPGPGLALVALTAIAAALFARRRR